MKIAMSTDHRGQTIFPAVAEYIVSQGHELIDVPTCNEGSCDYPDMAYGVSRAVADGIAERGILICGSGIGMSIAANKVDGIRAALVHDEVMAEVCRMHNDANVICLSADLLGAKQMESILDIWLKTEFMGGRHQRRVNKITAIEERRNPAEVTD